MKKYGHRSSLITILIALTGLASATSETCPTDAHLLQAQQENRDGMFINVDHPIGCSGIVTAWHFCYYTLGVTAGYSYEAAFAVYNRRPGIIIQSIPRYVHVNGSYVNVSRSSTQISSIAAGRDFVCEVLSLSPRKWFNVTSDAVIGVCVLDNTGSNGNGDDDDGDRRRRRSTRGSGPLNVVATGLDGHTLEHGAWFSCTEASTDSVSTAFTSPLSMSTLHVAVVVQPPGYSEEATTDQGITGTENVITTSPTSAETSATSATSAETSATSATSAETSATSAETSATSATSAETSATSAETSATSATSAETSATSATSAETSATSAETSATSATSAETSATSATSAETSATSATSAETSATSATSASPSSSGSTTTMTTVTNGTSPTSVTSVTSPPPTTMSTPGTATNGTTTLSDTTLETSDPTGTADNSAAVLAAPQVAGVATGIALALVVVCVSMAAIIIWVRKRRQSIRRQTNHPRIGRDHFVIITNGSPRTPQPYEEPIPTLARGLPSGNKNQLQNNSAQNVPRYEFGTAFEETQENLDSHYDFGSDPFQNEDYSRIGYSRICTHHYHLVERVPERLRNENPYIEPASNEKDLYEQFQNQKLRKILKNKIEVTQELGCGQFGNVFKATWTAPEKKINVAIKILSSGAPETNRIKMLQEGAIMGQFLHPNVIQLYGVVTTNDTIMLVMELASNGDLETHLISMSPDPGQLVPENTGCVLLSYSQQITFGMYYLSSKGFIHRDLAARNVLLTEGQTCKIADFGMSRDLADENYYISQGGKIPVKWTAPEAVYYKKYSQASDVWSYGCLLYEIWSLGKTPFQQLTNTETLEKLKTGYRLPPPPGCSRALYAIMIKCWHPNPSSRPTFRDVMVDLMEPESKVLEMPEDALQTHTFAGVLGASLEAGEKMYLDLQWSHYHI